MRGCLIFVGLAVACSGCNDDKARAARAEEAIASARAAREDLEAKVAAANQAPAPPADPALAKAQTAWEAFDRLRGDQFRTLAMLQAHRLQAGQGLDFLPADEAKRVTDWNAIEFRKRVPGVLVPGEAGRAAGADATTIVPSDDAARCAQLAKAWLAGEQGKLLASFGFKTAQCGAQTWKLTS